MKRSTLIKLIIGLCLTTAGLYIFLHNVDTAKLLKAFGVIRPLQLFTCCILVFLTLYLRAVRWRFILPDSPGSNKKHLFQNVSIGFFLNNILPGRIGELVRAFILWKKNGFSGYVSFCSIIVERMIDMVLFSLFFIIPVFFLPQCHDLVPVAITVSVFLVFLGIGLLAAINLSRLSPDLFRWIKAKIPHKSLRVLSRFSKEFLLTLQWIYSWKRCSLVILISIIIGCVYFSILLVLMPESSFGILKSMFVQSFAVIGAMIPFSPGYVGTLHAIMLKGFLIVGEDIDQARATVILYHAINYIIPVVFGLIFIFQIDLPLKNILHISRKEIVGKKAEKPIQLQI